MTEGAKALVAFLNNIGTIPAYQEPVSTQAKLPYISLGYIQGDFSESYIQQLTIWTQSEFSYQEAYEIADKIAEAVPIAGILYKTDKATLYIKRGSPFMQNQRDETPTIRAVLVNLEISQYF